MTLLNAQRRDKNEREIIDALRVAGVYVQQMDKSAGFDLLCAYHGIIEVVEVKTEDKPYPSNAEMHVAFALNHAGVKYHIIRSVDEALAIFGFATVE